MSRSVLRLVLDVVLTVALAFVLLTVVQLFLGSPPAQAPGEAARVLFLFMDVGLLVWLALLVIAVVRGRRRNAGPGVRITLLFALIGVIVNLIVVLVVGLVQGGWALLLVLFAIEGGIVTLLAAGIAVPIVHRVLLTPPAFEAPASADEHGTV